MSGIPDDARRLAAGVYAHDESVHVDLEEFILAAGGNPRSPRDRATAERVLQKIANERDIPYCEQTKPEHAEHGR